MSEDQEPAVRTVEEVRAAVERIRELAADDEEAHKAEDDLYMAVLRAIGDGTAEDPAEMARVALTADDIDFARWYA